MGQKGEEGGYTSVVCARGKDLRGKDCVVLCCVSVTLGEDVGQNVEVPLAEMSQGRGSC